MRKIPYTVPREAREDTTWSGAQEGGVEECSSIRTAEGETGKAKGQYRGASADKATKPVQPRIVSNIDDYLAAGYEMGMLLDEHD